MKSPPKKKQSKKKLTEAERHARFVETAKKVEASEKPEDFDKAFEKVTRPPAPGFPGKPAKP